MVHSSLLCLVRGRETGSVFCKERQPSSQVHKTKQKYYTHENKTSQIVKCPRRLLYVGTVVNYACVCIPQGSSFLIPQWRQHPPNEVEGQHHLVRIPGYSSKQSELYERETRNNTKHEGVDKNNNATFVYIAYTSRR